jgi:hypothetical protein
MSILASGLVCGRATNGYAASAVREEDNRPARKTTVRTVKVMCVGLHEAHRRQVEETMVTFP